MFQDLSSEHVHEDNRLALRFLMIPAYLPDEKLGYVGLRTMFGCPWWKRTQDLESVKHSHVGRNAWKFCTSALACSIEGLMRGGNGSGWGFICEVRINARLLCSDLAGPNATCSVPFN